MAQKKRRNILDRFMLGSEKSEGYARASLPSNRWELFFDIFKGSFGKLVVTNLLIILFCLPLIAVLVYNYMVSSGYGMLYPFSQSFGVGYGALHDLVGLEESVVFQANSYTYILMPIVLAIAGVGLAGGAYVIRNMVWTEGVFTVTDFWQGIKKNFKQLMVIMLVYGIVFYLASLSLSIADVQIASGAQNSWLFVVSKVVTYIVLFMITVMTLHMITMAVTYETTILGLYKNALYFTIGLLPQNIVFLFLAGLPFILFLIGGTIALIAGFLVFLFGISYCLLVWTDYCQWTYDKFVNEKLGVKKGKGIYSKIPKQESGALKVYTEQRALAELSAMNRRPIKPITDDELKVAELPTSFSRADIERLNQSKQAIYDDHERYVQEHTVKKEEQNAETKKELEKIRDEREKRIEKAKRELEKRDKKK